VVGVETVAAGACTAEIKSRIRIMTTLPLNSILSPPRGEEERRRRPLFSGAQRMRLSIIFSSRYGRQYAELAAAGKGKVLREARGAKSEGE
jgi:hypothetical protein